MKKEVFIIVGPGKSAEEKSELLIASDNCYGSYYEVELNGFFTTKELAYAELENKKIRFKKEEVDIRDPKNSLPLHLLERNLAIQEKVNNSRIVKATVTLSVEELT